MDQEYYFSLHTQGYSTILESVTDIYSKYLKILDINKIDSDQIILIRFFCSDIYNQLPVIEHIWKGFNTCQKIYIGQAPLDSHFISVQSYAIAGDLIKGADGYGSLLYNHGGYASLWTLDYPNRMADSEIQTDEIINNLNRKLVENGMGLAENVVRTWYYLRDIDNNYKGMIKSRLKNYENAGLTAQTHSFASTGIEGLSPWPHALVGLQAHAISGIEPAQIQYLKALDNLSPTYDYGVNFERAAKIVYGDRAHCHISGTASIDKYGNVLHKQNVVKQFERAVENIDALLTEGNMNLKNLRCATIYLRDGQDYQNIAPAINNLLPKDCAINVTRGSVCRPEWLVEIEGEAIAPFKSRHANYI